MKKSTRYCSPEVKVNTFCVTVFMSSEIVGDADGFKGQYGSLWE